MDQRAILIDIPVRDQQANLRPDFRASRLVSYRGDVAKLERSLTMGLTKIIRCRMFCVMCILSAVVVTFVYVGGINQSDSTGEGGRRTTHRTGDPCDGECHRFRRLLAQWPNEKPKAAIVYLLHAPRLKVAIQGISTVDKFFGRQFDYPIIVFHEAGLNATRRDQVRKAVTWNKERVFFQKVEFKVPTFLKKPVPLQLPAPCQKPIGYRHMCRFHAKGN